MVTYNNHSTPGKYIMFGKIIPVSDKHLKLLSVIISIQLFLQILNTDIIVTSHELNIQSCIGFVMAPDCGGIDVFIGTVRNLTKGKQVMRLEFEAYEKMALSEMRKLCDQAFDRWPVQRIALHHRTGTLQVGEVPVIIAVAAAHRDAAFEACRFLIDNLKKTVPIWKKEVFADCEVWVSATP